MGKEDRPAAPPRGGGGEESIEALEIEQRIAAEPAIVFAYLTDPTKFIEWMGIGAELNPSPGGAFRLDVDGEHFPAGRYLEVEPPHRLVMTWGWEGNELVAPESTTVEITLTAEGDGTLLRLRHTGLPTEQEMTKHRAGWRVYTTNLAARLA